MAWICLNLRKQSLLADINSTELRDLQLGRKRRAVHRNKSYDQSVINRSKKLELADAKEAYMALRESKPEDYGSDEYNEWYQSYTEAQEDFNFAKTEINDYYDMILQEMEEEAADEEAIIDEEQTYLEAELEAMTAELESVKERISKDIEQGTIKL